MERKIKTILVDDEPLACKRLKKLLNADANIEVSAVCENLKEAIEQIDILRPDLVFLDIRMSEINDFEMLHRIHGERMPVVIVVTACDEYALKAFEVHALDYPLKPFNEDCFQNSLKRAKKAVIQKDNASLDRKIDSLLEHIKPKQEPLLRILVKSRGRYFFLKVQDIDWVESAGNYVRLHSGSKDYMIRETMTNMEIKLDSDTFFRIHRSAIVNVEKIKELEQCFHGDYRVTLYNGKKLTMSRNYKELIQPYH